LVSSGERRSVRLMDFRHTFASERISQWSRQSQPIAHHLLLLARYLGHPHRDPTSETGFNSAPDFISKLISRSTP
jgi:hypothetical protein